MARRQMSKKNFKKLKSAGGVQRFGDGWIYTEAPKLRGPVICVKSGRVIGWRGKRW